MNRAKYHLCAVFFYKLDFIKAVLSYFSFFNISHKLDSSNFSYFLKYSIDSYCVKSDRIRNYSGPYFRENKDQNNSEYGHFSRSEQWVGIRVVCYLKREPSIFTKNIVNFYMTDTLANDTNIRTASEKIN